MAERVLFVPVLLKYSALMMISYLIARSVSQNKLDQNHLVLIAFAITVVYAILDLYGGIFPGMLNAICNCPPVAACKVP